MTDKEWSPVLKKTFLWYLVKRKQSWVSAARLDIIKCVRRSGSYAMSQEFNKSCHILIYSLWWWDVGCWGILLWECFSRIWLMHFMTVDSVLASGLNIRWTIQGYHKGYLSLMHRMDIFLIPKSILLCCRLSIFLKLSYLVHGFNNNLSKLKTKR